MADNLYPNSAEALYLKSKHSEIKRSTLLITGNGFDLQCGLASKYSDFFLWCEKTIFGFKDLISAKYSTFLRQVNIQSAFQNNEQLTVWDLYFTFKSEIHGDKWCDIEVEMNESFQSGFWNDVLDKINYFQENGEWNDPFSEEWYFAWMLDDRYHKNFNWLNRSMGLTNRMLNIKKVTENEFYNNLFKELKIFEQRFADYLSQELDNHKNYLNNQFDLLHQLVRDTTSDSEFQVITFNYTLFHPQIDVVNIHGNLNAPIFGISNINNRNTNAHVFTKSNRRMNDELIVLRDFIKEEKNTLVFYGVSFNDLDLDYYKILIENHGNGSIYFCYSDYGSNTRKTEYENMVRQLVNKLNLEDFYSLRELGKIRIKKIDFKHLSE